RKNTSAIAQRHVPADICSDIVALNGNAGTRVYLNPITIVSRDNVARRGVRPTYRGRIWRSRINLDTVNVIRESNFAGDICADKIALHNYSRQIINKLDAIFSIPRNNIAGARRCASDNDA